MDRSFHITLLGFVVMTICWSTVSFAGSHMIRIPGMAFKPTGWTVPYATGLTGCLFTAEPATFVYPVHLPDGATIETFTFFYSDQGPGSVDASLRRYQPSGIVEIHDTVSSTGEGGIGTVTSAWIGHVVDNTFDSFAIRFAFGDPTGLEACAVQINYAPAVAE